MPVSEMILISLALLTIAIISAGLFRNVSIPYTVILVLIGIALSEIANIWQPMAIIHEFKLTPDLVFFVFLPALIFESGLSLDTRQLMKDLAPVLTMAVPALLISTTLVGTGVWLILDIDFTVALLFGALISATDPVAVVALFKELGAPARLNVLVEGESLFNDATAIVVFSILLAMVLNDSPVNMVSTATAIVDFLRVFVGGVVIGFLTGLFVSELLYRLQSSVSAILTMSIVSAYGSFIIAEHLLHVSGVMATVSSAVALSIYGVMRIPADVKSSLSETWEFIGLIANSLLFLLVGLAINVSDLLSNWWVILLVVLIVQLARAATVYSLVPAAMKVFKLPKVSLAERHILCWGGLKGGLAIAIVLSIPESMPGRGLLITLTLGVVLFTLIVNASTIRPLMHQLKLDRLNADEELELQQSLKLVAESSSEMLFKYQKSGVLEPSLSHHLHDTINQILIPVNPMDDKEQSWRGVFLEVVRVEYHTLDHLYHSGLISQYLLLEMRNARQTLRDNYSIEEFRYSIINQVEQGVFQRFERWVLKEFREKNWASGFLARYQYGRLMQHIQQDIADILLSSEVIEALQIREELDASARSEVIALYQQRIEARRFQLDVLRINFGQLYHSIEQELFSKVALINARVSMEHKFMHGEIGVKAYRRVVSSINQIFKSNEPRRTSVGGNIENILVTIPLFSGLSKQVLKALSAHTRSVTFLEGDVVIGEGEKGDALYIITRGQAQAYKGSEMNRKILGELGPDDFFGEMALMGDHVRSATVTALTDMTLMRLNRKDVLKISDQHQEVKQRLEEVMNERSENIN